MKRLLLLSVLAVASFASAHDIWIEPTANIIRAGDWVGLSLMLGNHGNEHRDFRMAGKVAAGDQNLSIVAPDGKKLDITPNLLDTGYTPQDGFWTARFQATAPGLYTAVSTFDKVMSYAPVRDVKCAKTYFVVSKSLDEVPAVNPGFDKALGAPFEIVPVTNPVTPMGSGEELKVRVLYKGKALGGARVGFVPRGAECKGELDPAYEKIAGADGTVTMTLKEANTYLISAHYKDAEAKGEGYTSINYSATICVVVPAICPCCVGG